MKEVDHVGRFYKYAGMMVPEMAVCLAWVWQPDQACFVSCSCSTAALHSCACMRKTTPGLTLILVRAFLQQTGQSLSCCGPGKAPYRLTSISHHMQDDDNPLQAADVPGRVHPAVH